MQLTEDSISSLVKKIAIPSSVGMLFHTMYNLTDTYFAGTLSDVGLAALSLSFAPFFFLMAFGIGMGQGTNALISHALGAKNHKKAALIQMQAITLSVVVSFLIMILGWFYVDDIFVMMGAQGEVLQLSLDYIHAILIGAPIMVLGSTLNAGLMSLGDTKTYRNGLIVGFFVNLILDPLLLSGIGPFPALGIAGIGWATVLIQGGVAVYLLTQLRKTVLIQKCSVEQLKPQMEPMLEILHQGFPASLNMMLVSVGVFVITTFVGKFGPDAIAAHGVGMRLEQVVLLPAMGLNSAALSLVGQNYGARKLERVWEIYRFCLAVGMGMMVFGALVVYAGAPYVMQLFAEGQGVIDFGVQYLRIDAFVFPAYVLLFLSIAVLQGLKRPLFGFFINLSRQIVFPLLLIPVLMTSMAWGIVGVWWGIFAINWTIALTTFFVVLGVMKSLE